MPAQAKQYDPVEDVVYIPLESLRVDPCNIRGGAWDGDSELINSVERTGIHQPLVVRHLDTDESGDPIWGIVAGSRRFNAAIEAGLDRAPCRIMELDRTQAMLYSMEENRNRRPTAKWRDINFVGDVADQLLDGDTTKRDVFHEIGETVGMSYPTISRYYRIYQLPGKVKALVREPEDLRQTHRDFLRSFTEYSPEELPVSLHTLDLVYKKIPDWSVQRQVVAALEIDDYDEEVRENLLERWADEPEASLQDLVADKVRKGVETRSIQFQRKTLDALAKASVDRQIRASELVRNIVSSWLRDEEYL